MFWSLDLDDFSGKFCEAGKFPLLRALSHSVGTIVEGDNHGLTQHVNPNIRFLTKYTGGAASSVRFEGLFIKMGFSVVVSIMLVLARS